jgi:hypothetical protein
VNLSWPRRMQSRSNDGIWTRDEGGDGYLLWRSRRNALATFTCQTCRSKRGGLTRVRAQAPVAPERSKDRRTALLKRHWALAPPADTRRAHDPVNSVRFCKPCPLLMIALGPQSGVECISARTACAGNPQVLVSFAGPFNDLFVFSPTANAWTMLSPSGSHPSPRWSMGSAVTPDGTFYIFGGWTGNGEKMGSALGLSGGDNC